MKTLMNSKDIELSTYKLLIVPASNRNQHANYCPVKIKNLIFLRICTLFSPKPKWHIFTQKTNDCNCQSNYVGDKGQK